MRVAHFTDTYLPRRDGVVTSTHTLDQQLRYAGHDSLLVVPRHHDVVAEAGQQLLTLRSLPCGVAQLRLAPWPRQRHVDRVAAWRPDVVHVHTPGPVGLLGVLAARRLGLPVVHSYHTDLDAYVDAYRVPTRVLRVAVAAYRRRLGGIPAALPEDRHGLLREGIRLLLDGADAVVVPTSAVLDRTSLPVRPDRVRVIPTGVAPASVTTGAVEDFRRRFGIAAGDRIVLAVGRVNAEKGVELLLAAFARLLTDRPEARLVLVGPVYDPELVAAAGRRVVVTGQLPPAEVAAAYAATERSRGVLAFASRTDTQGLVLQEAAHAGVPAVMTDAGLCARGPLAGAALCAPPTATGFASALDVLLTNPVLARSLADRARRSALAHTPGAYAGAMLGLYTEVVGAQAARAAA
ncbi:MAG TPA: glycosyltransferase [Mycobacteriales bacterium]|jgi:glycosyltransferase involved in cell wall biosynthesis